MCYVAAVRLPSKSVRVHKYHKENDTGHHRKRRNGESEPIKPNTGAEMMDLLTVELNK